MGAVKETKFGTKVAYIGDEDDARTSNTRTAQRNRAIPHSMLKNRMSLHLAPTNRQTYDWQHIARLISWQRSVTSPKPKAFASDLSDDHLCYLLKYIILGWSAEQGIMG